eukprot:6090278-Pleurochrysis_carterae.AAC.2
MKVNAIRRHHAHTIAMHAGARVERVVTSVSRLLIRPLDFEQDPYQAQGSEALQLSTLALKYLSLSRPLVIVMGLGGGKAQATAAA